MAIGATDLARWHLRTKSVIVRVLHVRHARQARQARPPRPPSGRRRRCIARTRPGSCSSCPPPSKRAVYDGSKRERHVDPVPIAAALATFSLEGAATVTMDVNNAHLFAIQCDGSAVYTLTGSAVRDPVYHRVAVTADHQRLAVTLRFADSADA